ncbi:hypothetical protein CIL05_19140 [Virgibacillus profundi]|uniref:DUF5673 domain-containing protein n=2 Tax=Virgibacillus profundi TaxID=2024555 RepID=A0A2A2I7L0_9BACI|nr:hypothetical protein CIL05_19140 [Virgibacillus profundi]PXY52159.1 hypothetical protein CIT14_19240 [Virgibacillus profundi]
MDILFLIVIGYFSYKFIQVLVKMKQKFILPKINEDIAAIRKHPDKPVDFPVYSKQKVGIIIYSLILLFVIIMFLLGVFFQLFDSSLYLLLLLPIVNSYNILNLFAVVEDGLLSGSRFVAWNKIKSFEFVRIDVNHKFYGFSAEANEGYQLKVKTKFYFTSCVITSDEMKDRLNHILSEHVQVNEKASALKEEATINE